MSDLFGFACLFVCLFVFCLLFQSVLHKDFSLRGEALWVWHHVPLKLEPLGFKKNEC